MDGPKEGEARERNPRAKGLEIIGLFWVLLLDDLISRAK